jgi:hypothetical protein
MQMAIISTIVIVIITLVIVIIKMVLTMIRDKDDTSGWL